ncbi:hypothetical protein PMZ80_001173 [Knufia obscura]|uniref:Uncharacterized protein n=1 Tax=Knufia obscura TaxID=1635080 RepID=A0ABR0S2E9_9EURO|nr:hypothetical protein PMZ80_001173 [Knufia obscura]
MSSNLSRASKDGKPETANQTNKNDGLLSNVPPDWLDNPEHTSLEEVDRLFDEVEAETKMTNLKLAANGTSESGGQDTGSKSSDGKVSARKKQKSVLLPRKPGGAKTNRE